MRKKRKNKILGVWLLLFWFFAMILEQTAKRWSLETLLCETRRDQQQVISRNNLEEIAGKKEDTLIKATAWTYETQVLVENHSLARKEYADCTSIWPDPEGGFTDILSRRMSGGKLLEGTYSYAGDKEGCFISSSLAVKLFGSVDVCGKWLQFYGSEKKIRGVIKGDRNKIWILAQKDETFPYLLLKYGHLEEKRDSMQQQEKIRQFISAHGILGDFVIISGNRMYFVVRLLSYVPLWVAFFNLVFVYRKIVLYDRKCLMKQMNRRKVLVKSFLNLVYGIALCCFLWMLIKKTLWIPSEFIPTRWSDFSFWIQKYQEIIKNIREIQQLLPIEWYESWKKIIGLTLICSICSGIGMKRLCSWLENTIVSSITSTSLVHNKNNVQ